MSIGSTQSTHVGNKEVEAHAFYPSDFLARAKERFSVRKYRDTRVEDEKIRTIVEAGRVAPTAANKQPYRIISIRSADGIARLSKGATTFGATSAFIICADLDAAWKRPFDGKSTSDIDASIITDHMMHAAVDIGLGTLWMTYFEPAVIRHEFKIPQNFEPVNILLVGYSADKEAPSDRHSHTRKPYESVVIEESF